MKNLRNKVQLIGNLVSDPDFKEIDNRPIVKFMLVTSETYRPENNTQKITDTMYHNIVALGKTARIVNQYLKKGNRIALEGKLINRKVEESDEKSHYITEILMYEVLMLGQKKVTNV